MVPIIVFFLFKKSIHWSVWPSVLLCLMGGYLLTNFHDATVRLGDTLVIICAVFWSLHIIFISKIIKEFDAPILIGLIQTIIVSILSVILASVYEDFIIEDILSQKFEILYAGILSEVSPLYYKYMLRKIYLQHQLRYFFTRRCFCHYSSLDFIKSNFRYK